MSNRYDREREARLPLVRELRVLGFSKRFIADAVGVNPITLSKDVARLVSEGCEFSDATTKKSVLFQNALRRYCLLQTQPESCGDGLRDRVLDILANHLDIWRLHHVAKINQRWIEQLLTPPHPPEDQRIYHFFVDVVGPPVEISGNQETLIERLVTDFVSSLAGRAELPGSIDQLEFTFVDWCLTCREVKEKTRFYWSDNAGRLVDSVLRTLTLREARVLGLYYGLSGHNRNHSFPEIADEFEVNTERIKQIYAKAMRKLRHRDRSIRLKQLVQPADRSVEFGNELGCLTDRLLDLAREIDPNRPVQSTQIYHSLNENLFKPVSELELGMRANNCLENEDIKFVYELVQRTEAELLKTKYVGRKTLNEIKEILADDGLSLGMKLTEDGLKVLAETTSKRS